MTDKGISIRRMVASSILKGYPCSKLIKVFPLELLHQRIPSRTDLIPLLMVCALPTHAWAYFVFLYELPAYLMRLDAMDILGILSYSQVRAFVDCLWLLVLLIVATIVLPRQWLREHFLVQATILVLVSAVWVIPVHFWLWRMKLKSVSLDISMINLSSLWSLWLPGLVWLLIYFTVIIVLSLQVRKPGKFNLALRSFVDRLTVLSSIYLLADVLYVSVIIIRNLV